MEYFNRRGFEYEDEGLGYNTDVIGGRSVLEDWKIEREVQELADKENAQISW